MLTFGEKMTKHVGDNKKIITLMLASAAVLAMYLPELFDLLRPLFSGIADGGLSYFFVFFLKLAVYIAGFAAIAVSAKKYAGLSLFGRKADKLSPKYAVLIFVLTFAAVFFSCRAIDFDLAVVAEVGTSATLVKAANTLSFKYLPFLCRALLSVMAAALFQEFFEELFPNGKLSYVPFGGLIVFATCGVAELFISAELLLIWFYWVFFLFYGLVYTLSGKRFLPTLIIALIVVLF